MEQNELKVCVASCFFLQLSLIWPPKSEQFHPSRRFYCILGLFFLGPWLFFMVLMFLHLVESYKIGEDISEDLSLIASIVEIGLLMLLYVTKQKKMAVLLQNLGDFKLFGKPPGFDELNGKIEYLTRKAGYYGTMGGVSYSVYKLLEIPECKRSRKIAEICGTVMPTWSPFEINEWFLVGIGFFVIVVVSKAHVMIACQILEISSYLKLRIGHLNSLLLTCFNGDPQTDARRFHNCIRYHNFIIRCSNMFDECMSSLMFSLLVSLGVICGLVENQFVKQHNAASVIHMFGWLPIFFVACFGGQILIDSSVSVAEAAYSSRWYETDLRLRRGLILVIMRSQKQLFLSTGSYDVLNFPLFVSVMKMSYSVLTVLQ